LPYSDEHVRVQPTVLKLTGLYDYDRISLG
jgi:hypothetical protein